MKLGDSIGQLARRGLGGCQRRPAVLEIAGVFLQVADGLFQLSGNLIDPRCQIGLLLREPRIFGFELLPACRLVPDCGLEAGDRLAVFGVAPLGAAEPVFGFGDLAFCAGLERFAVAGLERHTVDFGSQRTSVGVDCRQPGAQLPVVVGSRPDPQGPQLLRVLAEFRSLGGLAANRIQLPFDLAHDVGQPQQVLGHSFELALRVELAGLETADARGFFEDASAGDVRGLQELIDAALLDDAVRRTPRTRPQKQVTDVLEPGRQAIDEIF